MRNLAELPPPTTGPHPPLPEGVRRLEKAVGSTAGSGSGAFHVYREHRRTEMDRIEAMERENEKQKIKDEFDARVAQNKKEDEARLERNRRNRKRRKGGKGHKTNEEDEHSEGGGEEQQAANKSEGGRDEQKTANESVACKDATATEGSM